MTMRRVAAPPGIRHPAEVAAWLASGGTDSAVPSGYEPSRALSPDEDEPPPPPPRRSPRPAPLDAPLPEEPEETEETRPLAPAARRPPPPREPQLMLLAFGKTDVVDFASCRVTLTDSERKAVRAVLIRAYKRYQREVVSRFGSYTVGNPEE